MKQFANLGIDADQLAGIENRKEQEQQQEKKRVVDDV